MFGVAGNQAISFYIWMFIPVSDPLVLNRLPTTRSGRRVIPPLAYWTGQRVMVYQQTQCIHVVPGSQNTLHGELSLSFKSDDVRI